MKKLLIAMITLSLFSCHAVPSYAKSELTIKDNRVKVKEDGVIKDYGTIKRVKGKYNGDVEIYTNKNYNKPAVTMKRDGSTRTQEFSNSSVKKCDLTCQYLSDDEDEE